MTSAGYYRFPTIHDDQIVFVSEDDLWTVSAEGGVARRLTSGLGAASYPKLSPDGKWLAFSGREEGHTEVYVMPAEGGQPKRLTYLGSNVIVVGWDRQGRIVFSSHANQPFLRLFTLFAVSPEGGTAQQLPYGPALTISYGPDGGCVLGRYGMVTREPAYWKRYRGGTAGDLWIDRDGQGQFERLIKLDGNIAFPLWVGNRIYFTSDHEGIGNLYSCTPEGKDVTRHTRHDDYYVRHPATDGRRIVYHAGADLYLFDPKANQSAKVEIEYPSPRTQRNRKFVEAAQYLEDYELHPQGYKVTLNVRGKAFAMGNWHGPVSQHGESDGVRYRLPRWLSDGKRLVVVSDAEGEERLEIHHEDGLTPSERLSQLDVGRPEELRASPIEDKVALSNHRNELMLIDLKTKERKILDRSGWQTISGFDWSPDGRWIAYGFAETPHTTIIKICEAATGKTHRITRPVHYDVSPQFDPEGNYLYFLSHREFDPVYDNLHFDLGFPRGVKPYLVTLRKDLPSPFLREPKAPDPEGTKPNDAREKGKNGAEPVKVEIDFEGIEERVLAFPVSDGRYQQLAAMKGKILYTSLPIEGSLNQQWFDVSEPPAKATLEMFDFQSQKPETLIQGITSFKLSGDKKTLIYRAGNKLRVLKAGEKPDEKLAQEPPNEKSGWINLGRVKTSVTPPWEWQQMYREAWRLQRDHFWSEDMSKVDWETVYERYLPLLDRISTRGEFSDLMWEMQGELGTSHAYEFGGDYRPAPQYLMGFLGADFAYDQRTKAWKITHIVQGDPWDEAKSSPLIRSGVNAHVGDTLLAIGGRRLTRDLTPGELLVNQASAEISITLGDKNGKSPRTVTVKTLKDETSARYRDWVEKNRAYVHEQTRGRVGYVHIPDMGPQGYSEFHRYFLMEIDRDGLVVDVRFNGGGHVSSLLLEKLARRRLAFIKTRWFGVWPWPDDSPAGPLVALTNEWAGSDGDIFSHSFKLLKLGPLIGKRTWGGVIGISPRQWLVDKGITTQPEHSFWFIDVGWDVENYGTDPDIEVEMKPQDYAAGKDPQLERATQEILAILEKSPPLKADLHRRPSRALPKLPKE